MRSLFRFGNRGGRAQKTSHPLSLTSSDTRVEEARWVKSWKRGRPTPDRRRWVRRVRYFPDRPPRPSLSRSGRLMVVPSCRRRREGRPRTRSWAFAAVREKSATSSNTKSRMERRALMKSTRACLGFPGFLMRSSRQSVWSERMSLFHSLLTRMQRLDRFVKRLVSFVGARWTYRSEVRSI